VSQTDRRTTGCMPLPANGRLYCIAVQSAKSKRCHFYYFQSVGGSSPQNWGCNASKPLWSSRSPILIRSSPESIYEIFKRENFITHHHLTVQANFSTPNKRFDRHSDTAFLFTVTFLLDRDKLGVQSQKLGCNASTQNHTWS